MTNESLVSTRTIMSERQKLVLSASTEVKKKEEKVLGEERQILTTKKREAP